MRITKAIDRYAQIQIGEIKRVKTAVKNTWRLPVGDWRVFYTYEFRQQDHRRCQGPSPQPSLLTAASD